MRTERFRRILEAAGSADPKWFASEKQHMEKRERRFVGFIKPSNRRSFCVFWTKHIRISESSYTIGDEGRLVIPATDLAEMGLSPGQNVFVAYIADDDLANQYSEFTVSSVSLSEMDCSQRIAVPQPLLEEAGIDPDGEVQVICVEGAIIIAEDSALNEDELSEVVDRLRAANDRAQQFANEPDITEGGSFHDGY